MLASSIPTFCIFARFSKVGDDCINSRLFLVLSNTEEEGKEEARGKGNSIQVFWPFHATPVSALIARNHGCRAILVAIQEEYGPFTEDDIVRLAPTDEEREVLTRQLIAKREEARLAKKASKSSKKSARREKFAVASAATPSSSSPPKPSTSGGVADDRKPNAAAAVAGEDVAGEEKKISKRRKRERAAEKDLAAAAAAAANGASAGPNSARLADAAAEAVKKTKEESKVYASLFGKKNVSNEHLFIATAGHRYNLG